MPGNSRNEVQSGFSPGPIYIYVLTDFAAGVSSRTVLPRRILQAVAQVFFEPLENLFFFTER